MTHFFWFSICDNNPTNTQHNKHVIITSKRRFGVIITCLLRCVFAGKSVTLDFDFMFRFARQPRGRFQENAEPIVGENQLVCGAAVDVMPSRRAECQRKEKRSPSQEKKPSPLLLEVNFLYCHKYRNTSSSHVLFLYVFDRALPSVHFKSICIRFQMFIVKKYDVILHQTCILYTTGQKFGIYCLHGTQSDFKCFIHENKPFLFLQYIYMHLRNSVCQDRCKQQNLYLYFALFIRRGYA